MTARRALFIAAALALVSAPLHAQDILDDNELRTNIIAMAGKIAEAEERTQHLAGQVERLQVENAQLRGLIEEIRSSVDRFQEESAAREQGIVATEASAQGVIDRSSGRAELRAGLLRSIINGEDARTYSSALAAYGLEGDVDGALEGLGQVVALGGLSRYSGPALYWTGVIHYQQDDFDAARDALARFVGENPGDHREADALLMLAEMSRLSGGTDHEELEGRLLITHPESDAAHKLRALNR